MTPKPFHYAEFAPTPTLADHVLTYWAFESHMPAGESFRHHVWPDGCVSLQVVTRGGAVLRSSIKGPVLESGVVPITGGLTVVGVRFRPDTGGIVLGVPAPELRDRVVPAERVLGPEIGRVAAAAAAAVPNRSAVAAVFDAWLSTRIEGTPPIDAVVRRAVHAIVEARGNLSITRLAADVGLGIRQLQRRFRRATGLSPKEYARIRRLRTALYAVLRGESGWSGLAHALGYADQSHLIHEFGDMTGFAPEALRERLGLIEHVDVTP